VNLRFLFFLFIPFPRYRCCSKFLFGVILVSGCLGRLATLFLLVSSLTEAGPPCLFQPYASFGVFGRFNEQIFGAPPFTISLCLTSNYSVLFLQPFSLLLFLELVFSTPFLAMPTFFMSIWFCGTKVLPPLFLIACTLYTSFVTVGLLKRYFLRTNL